MMMVRHTVEVHEAREEVIAEAAQFWSDAPRDTTVALLGMIRELEARNPKIRASLRFTVRRLRVLERFGQIRLEEPGLTDEQIFRRLACEIRHAHPEQRVSVRAMKDWLATHNRIGDSGLAGGWPALLDRRGSGGYVCPSDKVDGAASRN